MNQELGIQEPKLIKVGSFHEGEAETKNNQCIRRTKIRLQMGVRDST